MVSVIIPSYNYGRFIGQAIGSVLAQTYPDFECIVIDNGSTDNTREIIQPFLADDRVRYFYSEKGGVAEARNRGLRVARGNYVLFLDADDLIEPQKLAHSVAYLDAHPDTDLVYSDMRYFADGQEGKLFYDYACNTSADKPWMPYISGQGKPLLDLLVNGNIMVISSPLTRKDSLAAISFFDQKLRYNEDWDLWLRLALNNGKFAYSDQPGNRTLVRVHRGSASRDVFSMQASGLRVLLRSREALVSFGLKTLVDSRIISHEKMIRESLLAASPETIAEKMTLLRELGFRRAGFMKLSAQPKLMQLFIRLFPFNLKAT